jgi:hypothetical protein
MESKRSSPQQRPSRAVRAVRAGLAVVISLAAVASLATGCLDRPVAPQEPNTSNVFVDQSVRAAIDRIDLLFMIDNSASMQDKQILLSQAVPVLLKRLLNPPCVTVKADANGEHPPAPDAQQPTEPSGDCPSGYAREFPPVPDVHIGVVTSSMGGHGNAKFCFEPTRHDNAHLLTQDLRNDVTPPVSVPTTYRNIDGVETGFLNWDNRAAGDPRKANPAGTNRIDILQQEFTGIITAAGEDGCGYEASLEAWYRFLIDPNPPASLSKDENPDSPTYNKTVRSAEADPVILAQRKEFLRPDSLVAIIMLTDENDCSIADANYGWLASETKIDKGTAACAQNPNDPCCTFCGYSEAPAGCPDLKTDPGCTTDPKTDDATNVRCWDQKRRFGIDFLYPTSRYSTGLDSIELCPDSDFGDADCQCRRAKELHIPCSQGKPVRNPLYTDLQHSKDVIVPAEREPGLVFLAGIIGVPWQDLATDETRDVPGRLAYKRATGEKGLDWKLFYGEPTTAENPLGTKPTDALMWQDTAPRDGAPAHPLLGVTPAPPEAGPDANPINGHEWRPVNNEDLQYACIFDLAPVLGGQARDCAAIGKQTCDCFDPTDDLATVNARLKPLCQQPNGSYSTVQTRAKAYPGLRELEVLRFYGDNSIVASICPKVLEGDTTGGDYGYNPAVGAIIDRLKEKLGGRCLPRKLTVDDTGKLPCQVVEALSEDRKPPAGCGALKGRTAVDPSNAQDAKLDAAVRGALKLGNKCGPDTSVQCESFLLCKIDQLQGDGLKECQENQTTGENVYGYCYISDTADQKIGNPDLLANCPESERRLLRFVGDNVPAGGAVTFIACAGDTFSRETTETQATGQ